METSTFPGPGPRTTARLRSTPPPMPEIILPPMRADEIHPGDVIAGKYRVRAVLGRGQGLLVEAFHVEFDQRVVVKLLLGGAGDDRRVERVRREARGLAKLESEHAARILDVGTEGDGSFYLVRQYLDGTDLSTYVRQAGPLPLVDAVLVLLQVAEAVAEAHSHGIVLRELQPGHLFLTQRPCGAPLVKISDFGTAKLMLAAAPPGVESDVTATAMFGLSPYASPELLRKARDVDARTDVWSLGAILYELLAGRPPFTGEATRLMLQITREEPAPLTSLRGDVPAEIDQILAWAMAKDVDGRFRSVHALAHALAPWAPPEGRVLVDRIAQMAESRRPRRRASAPPPPPSFPSARAPSTPPPAAQRWSAPPVYARPMNEDSVTHLHVPPPPPPSGPGASMPPVSVSCAPRLEVEATLKSPKAQAPRAQVPKAALAVVIASAVLVPLLLALLLVKRTVAVDVAARPAAVESTVAAALPPAAAPPAPVAAPPPVAAAPAPAAPPEAAPAPAAPPAAAPAAPPPADPPPRASRAAAPPVAAAGPNGTLLAAAVGGSCTFFVNGGSRGTSSSIRVSLRPGTYSVVCRTASGAKSKSVTVRGGETAMAAFKL
jgi:serine/threonine-protein kinase